MAGETKQRIDRGIQLVRDNMELVTAATCVGVTVSALRGACMKAGVLAEKRANVSGEQERRRQIAERDAKIVCMVKAGAPLDTIGKAVGMTPWGLKRIVRRDLGIDLDVPKRNVRRTPSEAQRKSLAAAEDYLDRLADGEHVSYRQLAREHVVPIDTLENRVRKLRRERGLTPRRRSVIQNAE